ncbi:hypothetical protein Tco_0666063 [Tanacetum coccineum]
MSDPSLFSEYERYIHSDFVTHFQTTEFATFDVLGFWKAKETTVISKSAFSTSGRVLSIRRTRLTPTSLEMCQENEAIPLSDEEIALDAASSECSMSGPGSGGEEAVDYGYDVYHDDY